MQQSGTSAQAPAAARSNPVYEVLYAPNTVGGVAVPLVVLNATLSAVFILNLHLYGYLVVTAISHYLLRFLTRIDDQWWKVYVRYSGQADLFLVRGSHESGPDGGALR